MSHTPLIRVQWREEWAIADICFSVLFVDDFSVLESPLILLQLSSTVCCGFYEVIMCRSDLDAISVKTFRKPHKWLALVMWCQFDAGVTVFSDRRAWAWLNIPPDGENHLLSWWATQWRSDQADVVTMDQSEASIPMTDQWEATTNTGHWNWFPSWGTWLLATSNHQCSVYKMSSKVPLLVFALLLLWYLVTLPAFRS